MRNKQERQPLKLRFVYGSGELKDILDELARHTLQKAASEQLLQTGGPSPSCSKAGKPSRKWKPGAPE